MNRKNVESQIAPAAQTAVIAPRRGRAGTLVATIRIAARATPIDRPQVDHQLTELSAIERAAEVLSYSAYRLEYALSPGGHLRAWLKLNLLLALLLAIPTVLIMPVVTLFLGTVATWSQYLLATTVNILLALLAGTASVGLVTLLLFLIRVLRRL